MAITKSDRIFGALRCGQLPKAEYFRDSGGRTPILGPRRSSNRCWPCGQDTAAMIHQGWLGGSHR